ncbi:hypothetical protein [Nonomuraea sp. LPB2021202275-12-8]|uniref:hypothetical protein n=1 Tax=Nonomuraea sp. LPB2021202275-12-8 TaxID=3120159 RepID=UPI00300CCA77
MTMTFWHVTEQDQVEYVPGADKIQHSDTEMHFMRGDEIVATVPKGTRIGGTEVTEDLNPARTW